jgi:DNA-binding transcriptional regulator GbsR (MarR family)
MKLEEAKEEFIQAWGALGSSWGINRTMSSIHALLMANNEPLSTEDIMAALQISRGNANMNTRALIEWGLVKKHRIAGDRKEFFVAGKDVWEMARQIAKERRQRNSEEAESFKKRINDLHDFTSEISGLVDKFTRNDRNWFYRSLLKLLG